VRTDTISTSLRTLRETRGWSRETLAHLAGLSAAAVAQIETGRRTDVRLRSLVALADALDVSLDDLTGRAAGSCGAAQLRHQALLYDGMDHYVAAVLPYLRAGITGDEHPLAVASRDQLRALKAALGRDAKKVVLADSAQWYRSPSSALAAYRGYLADAQAAGARRIRVLGEPVWPRRAAAVAAWIRYESLVNLVIADAPALILCPYDVQSLPADVVAGARRTHPELMTGHGSVAVNDDYDAPEELVLAL
jgi:transcriptional regulator with XRE-family HTH domain